MADLGRLEKVLEQSDGDTGFLRCGGYLITSHQLTNISDSIQAANEASEKADKQIFKALDEVKKSVSDLDHKLDTNKQDGNKRASETETRLAVVESTVASMKDTLKWILRTVVFGVGVFILQTTGVIDFFRDFISGLF